MLVVVLEKVVVRLLAIMNSLGSSRYEEAMPIRREKIKGKRE
jgi:hypothetical protein